MITELLGRAVEMLYTPEDAAAWRANWDFGGQETSSGEHINEENALNVPPVKAAVTVLAETLACLPIEIFRQNANGKRTLAPEHPASNLLTYSPNAEMSSYTWKHTMQLHLGTWGNGYSYIQRNGRDDPVALWPLPPSPTRTRASRNESDGNIWYEIHNDKGGREAPIRAADMLHIPYFSLDGLIGKSPIRMVREAIGGSKAAERFANELFKNAAAADGVFKHPGKLSDGAYQRLKTSMAASAEHGNRHRRMILEEGMDFQGTSMRPGEVQMIEVRRFLLEEIARAYRISPTLLQDLTHGTYSNITELGRQFITYTMIPWLKLWEAEINRKLLKPPFHCYINPSEFLRGDHAARAIMHRTLFGIGAKSVNEIRDDEDMNPLSDPNADEHFVPLNMVPLSKANDPTWGKPAPQGGNPFESKKPGAVAPGDGSTPAEPGKEPVVKQSAIRPDALDAAEAVLADALRRMERIEANEALKAAREPATFISTLDAFYASHVPKIKAAILLPLRTVLTLRLAGQSAVVMLDEEADNIIAEHVGGKRELLLQAAECQPADLPARVAACIKDWGL